jgi:gas vesicle protein
MTNKTACAVSLAVGALIGSAATWIFAKKYYEKISKEEIDSVKKEFSKMRNTSEHSDEEKHNDISSLKETTDKIEHYDYTDHSKKEEPDITVKGVKEVNEPYVIAPDDFGEYMDYEQISLTYFRDGVLADEDTLEVIDDIAGTVGEDFADHFGEYEDDSVHIRNDVTRCEYEILADLRTYSDALSEKYGRVSNLQLEED